MGLSGNGCGAEQCGWGASVSLGNKQSFLESEFGSQIVESRNDHGAVQFW